MGFKEGRERREVYNGRFIMVADGVGHRHAIECSDFFFP